MEQQEIDEIFSELTLQAELEQAQGAPATRLPLQTINPSPTTRTRTVLAPIRGDTPRADTRPGTPGRTPTPTQVTTDQARQMNQLFQLQANNEINDTELGRRVRELFAGTTGGLPPTRADRENTPPLNPNPDPNIDRN